MSLRLRLFLVFAVAAAAVCVRLGIWQLDRLAQRKARNAAVAPRLAAPPIDARELPRDTAQARFRRGRVVGTPDYAHELIHAPRTRNGSPGAHLLTPIRLPGTDTAILVNRGWVYAPHWSKVNRAQWRETDSSFVGYADELPATGGLANSDRPDVIVRLSHDVVSKALPYPVFPTYVIAGHGNPADTASAADRIARLPAPALDNGPHFSYAVQWFGFAAVALVGAAVVIRQSRSGGASGPGPSASRAGANESR